MLPGTSAHRSRRFSPILPAFSILLLPLLTLAQVESGESSAAPSSATVFSPNVPPRDPPYVCKEPCDGTWVCQPQEGDPPTSSLGEGGGDCGTCDGGADASAESGGAGSIRVDPGCLHIEFELGGPRFPGALKPGALLLYAEELSPTVLTPEGLSYRYAGLLMVTAVRPQWPGRKYRKCCE